MAAVVQYERKRSCCLTLHVIPLRGLMAAVVQYERKRSCWTTLHVIPASVPESPFPDGVI
jgi:hypothetical protein